MDELLKYLHSLSAGTIQDSTYLERVLRKYWDEFNGSDETEMYGGKLISRMENVVWSPPILQFTIERHRGTVWGSSRGDVYE
jgi:DNA-binding protein Fis